MRPWKRPKYPLFDSGWRANTVLGVGPKLTVSCWSWRSPGVPGWLATWGLSSWSNEISSRKRKSGGVYVGWLPRVTAEDGAVTIKSNKSKIKISRLLNIKLKLKIRVNWQLNFGNKNKNIKKLKTHLNSTTILNRKTVAVNLQKSRYRYTKNNRSRSKSRTRKQNDFFTLHIGAKNLRQRRSSWHRRGVIKEEIPSKRCRGDSIYTRGQSETTSHQRTNPRRHHLSAPIREGQGLRWGPRF